MKTVSPLRYPGGKSAMTDFLSQVRWLNALGDRAVAEPFAGGAGAALSLLYLEETERIFLNDADPAIFDFWWAITHRSNQFLDRLGSKRVSMAEWRRQKATYHTPGRISRVDRGFSAFYLNRCNRSGIIMNGGPIGGVRQSGAWKLDARFNKQDLRSRCERVSEYRDRIEVSCEDGIDFVERLRGPSTFFFIDPPYFSKGPLLYLNALDEQYHARLAELLREMADEPWVLTYDDCREIRAMFRGWANVRPYTLRYTASQRRFGREVLITPRGLRLPRGQSSLAMKW